MRFVLLVVLGVAGWLWGCSPLDRARCEIDDDCTTGSLCVSGQCSDPGASVAEAAPGGDVVAPLAPVDLPTLRRAVTPRPGIGGSESPADAGTVGQEGEGEGEGEPSLCGNDALDTGEECDGDDGCGLDCHFGAQVCEGDTLVRDCYRDLASVDHGYEGDHGARFQDQTLTCNDEVVDIAGGFLAAMLDHEVTLCGRTVHAEMDDGAVVFTMRTLSLSGSLRFTGGWPVVFLVYGDVTIDGVLSVAALGAQSGAGPSVCVAGNAAFESGAGGAGGTNGTLGGAGGNVFEDEGGKPNNSPPDGIDNRLRGGCRGGNASGSEAHGGGGGGALQISSGATLTIHGTVSANGGGGEPSVESGGGGGGGSGGDVWLQAVRIVVDDEAAVVAQGGAGGSGGDPGIAGEDGAPDPVERALGVLNGGNGAGGAPFLGAQTGGDDAPFQMGAGGGGGGVGRIAVHATGCVPSAQINPAPLCL
jgi:hypothetical protein